MKRLPGPKPDNQNSFSNVVAAGRPYSRKNKPVGDLCLEIAEFAKDRDYRTLDYLLRMAAAEAYDNTSESFHASEPQKDELIGFWDWDVSNNLAFVDPLAAKVFDVHAAESVRGLPVEAYIKAIHPDDTALVSQTLYRVAAEGGCFKMTYRVIHNDSVVWIFAKGSCFMGPGGKPVRFPGALFDVTASAES